MSEDVATAAAEKESRRKPMLDLDRMTVQELTLLIAAAEAKRQDKQGETRAALLSKWQAEAAESGLTLDAVLAATASSVRPGRKPRKDAGGNLPVKYRGPNGEEWSGRGRPPKWLQTIEAEGRKREEFQV